LLGGGRRWKGGGGGRRVDREGEGWYKKLDKLNNV